MKLVQPLKVMLINVKKEEYTRKKDNTKGTLYKVSVDQDGECGTLSCTEEAFDLLSEEERFADVVLMTEYDDSVSWNPYKVVGVYED